MMKWNKKIFNATDTCVSMHTTSDSSQPVITDKTWSIVTHQHIIKKHIYFFLIYKIILNKQISVYLAIIIYIRQSL